MFKSPRAKHQNLKVADSRACGKMCGPKSTQSVEFPRKLSTNDFPEQFYSCTMLQVIFQLNSNLLGKKRKKKDGQNERKEGLKKGRKGQIKSPV